MYHKETAVPVTGSKPHGFLRCCSPRPLSLYPPLACGHICLTLPLGEWQCDDPLFSVFLSGPKPYLVSNFWLSHIPKAKLHTVATFYGLSCSTLLPPNPHNPLHLSSNWKKMRHRVKRKLKSETVWGSISVLTSLSIVTINMLPNVSVFIHEMRIILST